jgi:hypothetical protein
MNSFLDNIPESTQTMFWLDTLSTEMLLTTQTTSGRTIGGHACIFAHGSTHWTSYLSSIQYSRNTRYGLDIPLEDFTKVCATTNDTLTHHFAVPDERLACTRCMHNHTVCLQGSTSDPDDGLQFATLWHMKPSRRRMLDHVGG